VAAGPNRHEAPNPQCPLGGPSRTPVPRFVDRWLDAPFDDAGAARERPLESDGIRKRRLLEDRAHTRSQHHKAEHALQAAAMIRTGVDPALLDEAS
jgi:hypothetical protein